MDEKQARTSPLNTLLNTPQNTLQNTLQLPAKLLDSIHLPTNSLKLSNVTLNNIILSSYGRDSENNAHDTKPTLPTSSLFPSSLLSPYAGVTEHILSLQNSLTTQSLAQQVREIYSRVAYIYVRSRAKYLKLRTTTSKFNTLMKPLMQ